MRVRLPDVPGTLGLIAATLGSVDGDIRTVDVVEHDPDGTVVDDIVVDLPAGRLADALISAAQEVEGVYVDSIRPFSGTVDRRGQVSLLASVARHEARTEGLESLLAGRTSVVIAHRLSTVLTADRVLVVSDGRVVEDGSPAALVEAGGRFAAMVQAWEENNSTEG